MVGGKTKEEDIQPDEIYRVYWKIKYPPIVTFLKTELNVSV